MRHARCFQAFLAFASLALSPLVAAGVHGSGGGVTTTVGNPDPTTPSAEVQSQSSGFVQQNQQLANAGAAGTQAAGDAAPSGTKGQAANPGAAGTSPGGDASTRGADGKPGAPGTPGAPAAAPAPPAAPPAPPPDYVSVVRHLNRQPPDKAQDADAAGEPARTEADKPQAEPTPAAAATPPKPATPTPPRPNRAAADADKHAAPERLPAPPAASGGRGAAPDGYTFYVGLILAGALLAFAASIYLRTGGGNAAPP